jgi:hypothetical protein
MTAETKLDEMRGQFGTVGNTTLHLELEEFARCAVKLLRENALLYGLSEEGHRFLETGVPKDSP